MKILGAEGPRGGRKGALSQQRGGDPPGGPLLSDTRSSCPPWLEWLCDQFSRLTCSCGGLGPSRCGEERSWGSGFVGWSECSASTVGVKKSFHFCPFRCYLFQIGTDTPFRFVPVSFPFQTSRNGRSVPIYPLCKQTRDVGLYLADSVLPYSEEIHVATCIIERDRLGPSRKTVDHSEEVGETIGRRQRPDQV